MINWRYLLLFVSGYDLGAQAITYDITSLPSRACHMDSYSGDPVVRRTISNFRITHKYTRNLTYQNQGLLFPLVHYSPTQSYHFSQHLS